MIYDEKFSGLSRILAIERNTVHTEIPNSMDPNNKNICSMFIRKIFVIEFTLSTHNVP